MPTPLRQNRVVDRDYFPNWVEGIELPIEEARRVQRTATGRSEAVRVSEACQREVLGYLAKQADWDRSGYGARPSARKIAEVIGRHLRTVRDALKVLRLQGLVRIARQGGGHRCNDYELVTRAGRRRDRRASSRGTPPQGECHTTPPPPHRSGVALEGHPRSSGGEKHRHEDALRATRPGAGCADQSTEAGEMTPAEALRAAARARLASKSAHDKKKRPSWVPQAPSVADVRKGLSRP